MPGTCSIPATAPTRALVVERDADTRQMYGEFLRRSFCEIEEAEHGREALAKALARLPDDIVTETRLPGITGYELCRLLRQDALTRSTPIVVWNAGAERTFGYGGANALGSARHSCSRRTHRRDEILTHGLQLTHAPSSNSISSARVDGDLRDELDEHDQRLARSR
jgi:CheY-like chemotaxis protein